MLDAGRDLDAEIAEKVMGEPIEWYDHASNRWPILFFRELKPNDYGTPEKTPVPHYSTDIAAAFQVAEKFRLWIIPHDDGWYAGPEDFDGVYIDTDCNAVDGHLRFIESADTAPLAICRAALAALTARRDA